MAKFLGMNSQQFWNMFKKFQIANACLVGFIFLILVLARIGLFGYMPDLEEIKNPKKNLASNIYSQDYELLGSYFVQNRTEVKYEELSPWLVKALIATEDKRYMFHSGIDGISLLRCSSM